MSDYRKRVEAAMMNHHKKTAKTPGVKRKIKNAKPEQVVVNAIRVWAERRTIDLHVVESKAVYSKAAGRYLHSQTSESLPDLIGNWQHLSVWIEAKAPGRRGTLKPHQRDFLERKIHQDCFACCADNVADLDELFMQFQVEPSKDKRAQILLDHLPKQRE